MQQVQAPKPKISIGAHAQNLKTTISQGAFCYADRPAQLWYQYFPILFRRQHVLELVHYDGAMASLSRVVVLNIGRQAVDERVNNIVLDCSGDFSAGDYVSVCFGEAARVRVETPKLNCIRLPGS